MKTWPDAEVEQQLLDAAKRPFDAQNAIQALLIRVRELEKREAELTNRLEEIANLTQSQTAARIAREALKGTNDEVAR